MYLKLWPIGGAKALVGTFYHAVLGTAIDTLARKDDEDEKEKEKLETHCVPTPFTSRVCNLRADGSQ